MIHSEENTMKKYYIRSTPQRFTPQTPLDYIYGARYTRRQQQRQAEAARRRDAACKPWPTWADILLIGIVLVLLALAVASASGQQPPAHQLTIPGRARLQTAQPQGQAQHRTQPSAARPARQPITPAGFVTAGHGLGKVHAIATAGSTNVICRTHTKSAWAVTNGPATCIRCRVLTGQPVERK